MPVSGGSGAKLLTPRPPQQHTSGRTLGSAQTSPSTQTLAQAFGHSLTHSSVTGSYLYVTVQVTRDLHPVVFPEWRLPDESYELGVADVTLSQFQSLAMRLGRGRSSPDPSSPPSVWARWMASSMISVQDLLRVRPLTHSFAFSFSSRSAKHVSYLTPYCFFGFGPPFFSLLASHFPSLPLLPIDCPRSIRHLRGDRVCARARAEASLAAKPARPQ